MKTILGSHVAWSRVNNIWMTAAPERETPAAFLNSLEKKIQYVVLHSIQKIVFWCDEAFFFSLTDNWLPTSESC